MKRYRLARTLLALAAVGALVSGCGGVRGSHSVSPASFFMPGLMQNESPRPLPANPESTVSPSDASPSTPISGPIARTLPS
ncbi:MAG: hypothetical protein IT581_01510 [Verrucomicrobiales bacterium]|nr:hypothetical protein [Verrucomicrobiales bacterium]